MAYRLPYTEIKRLYADGYTARDIAEHTGCLPHSVRAYLSKERARASGTLAYSVPEIDVPFTPQIIPFPTPARTPIEGDVLGEPEPLEPLPDDTPKWEAEKARLAASDRPVSIVRLSDEHIPDQNPQAVAMNALVVKHVQPDLIVLAGDSFDFALISRFDHDRRAGKVDVLTQVRAHYHQYIDALSAACPLATIVFIDGNHDAREEVFANAAWQFGDTIESAYAELVRAGGRVLWLNGKQELNIGALTIEHGTRTGENSAKNSLKDDGWLRNKSSGHTHGVSMVVNAVNVFNNRRAIVTSLTLSFAGNNPPAYLKRKKDNPVKWVYGCQVWHVTFDAHAPIAAACPVIYYEHADGSMLAFVGAQMLTVKPSAANSTQAA